jgi:hypothetical protein
MKRLNFMSKCSKWKEKWLKVSHKSLKVREVRGEKIGEMVNKAATIKRLPNKTPKRWDSISSRVAHQSSKMTRKRNSHQLRRQGQFLIKLGI